MVLQNFTPIKDAKNKDQLISPPSKEGGPIGKSEILTLPEDTEHKIDEEVKPFVKVEKPPEVPPDLKAFGLTPVPPFHMQFYNGPKVPLSDNKIILGLHAPLSSSFRWLAELASYILATAHIKVKEVHGRIVRVVSKR